MVLIVKRAREFVGFRFVDFSIRCSAPWRPFPSDNTHRPPKSCSKGSLSRRVMRIGARAACTRRWTAKIKFGDLRSQYLAANIGLGDRQSPFCTAKTSSGIAKAPFALQSPFGDPRSRRSAAIISFGARQSSFLQRNPSSLFCSRGIARSPFPALVLLPRTGI